MPPAQSTHRHWENPLERVLFPVPNRSKIWGGWQKMHTIIPGRNIPHRAHILGMLELKPHKRREEYRICVTLLFFCMLQIQPRDIYACWERKFIKPKVGLDSCFTLRWRSESLEVGTHSHTNANTSKFGHFREQEKWRVDLFSAVQPRCCWSANWPCVKFLEVPHIHSSRHWARHGKFAMWAMSGQHGCVSAIKIVILFLSNGRDVLTGPEDSVMRILCRIDSPTLFFALIFSLFLTRSLSKVMKDTRRIVKWKSLEIKTDLDGLPPPHAMLNRAMHTFSNQSWHRVGSNVVPLTRPKIIYYILCSVSQGTSASVDFHAAEGSLSIHALPGDISPIYFQFSLEAFFSLRDSQFSFHLIMTV